MNRATFDGDVSLGAAKIGTFVSMDGVTLNGNLDAEGVDIGASLFRRFNFSKIRSQQSSLRAGTAMPRVTANCFDESPLALRGLFARINNCRAEVLFEAATGRFF